MMHYNQSKARDGENIESNKRESTYRHKGAQEGCQQILIRHLGGQELVDGYMLKGKVLSATDLASG